MKFLRKSLGAHFISSGKRYNHIKNDNLAFIPLGTDLKKYGTMRIFDAFIDDCCDRMKQKQTIEPCKGVQVIKAQL